MAGDTTDVPETLVRALNEGVTGALLGYTPTGERCTAYVMAGDLLAVQAADDDLALLRRLVNAGHLKAKQAADIEREVESGGAAAPLLFDLLPEELVTNALYERFRENTFRFLAGSGLVAFEPMDAVFVDNIQVGHDTTALLAELTAQREYLAALGLDLRMVLYAGQATASTEEQSQIVALTATGASLAEILDLSPLEATRTQILVATMLDAGTLELRSASASRLPDAPDYFADAGRWVSEPEYDQTPSSDVDILADADGDEHTEEVDRSGFTSTPGVSPVQLLTSNDVDDELAAFADHDYTRADGSFVQAKRSLDRVVLTEALLEGPRASDQVVVEMEEADPVAIQSTRAVVSLNFEGRKLVDTDARRKIEVTNEVLSTVVSAIDEALGRGVGQSRAQVLVEGTSGPHAALFSHVELLPGGKLPVDRVLRNLKKRPEGERRYLLNRAMADVIERSLSLADGALDQPGMERMLETIAGYQQRMGV